MHNEFPIFCISEEVSQEQQQQQQSNFKTLRAVEFAGNVYMQITRERGLGMTLCFACQTRNFLVQKRVLGRGQILRKVGAGLGNQFSFGISL